MTGNCIAHGYGYNGYQIPLLASVLLQGCVTDRKYDYTHDN